MILCLLAIFFISSFSIPASVLEKSKFKVIVYKNDEKLKIAAIGKTVRLKSKIIPSSTEDTNTTEFIKISDNNYMIKFKDGYLCKKYADSYIGICDNYMDSNTIWKVKKINDYVQFKMGSNCLKKMNYDNDELTKGYYLNVGYCRDNELYQFKIVDLCIRNNSLLSKC